MNEIFDALENYRRAHDEVTQALYTFEDTLRALHNYRSNVIDGEVKEVKKRSPRKKRESKIEYGEA